MADEKRRCVVLGGGPITARELELLRADDIVWAADAGLLAARRAGLRPALCLGDWDSCPRPDDAAELIVLPTEKDDTDTHHAARLLIERGFDEALLLGCIGGRLDHTLANLATLLFLTRAGVRAWMVGGGAEVTALENGTLLLPRRPDCYLSLFAADGTARGVSLAGTKYPLSEAELTADFPVGVSNEITAPQARVTVRAGALFVALCRRENAG